MRGVTVSGLHTAGTDPEAEEEGQANGGLVALVCTPGILRRCVQLLCASDPETRLGSCMALAKLCAGGPAGVHVCEAELRVGSGAWCCMCASHVRVGAMRVSGCGRHACECVCTAVPVRVGSVCVHVCRLVANLTLLLIAASSVAPPPPPK